MPHLRWFRGLSLIGLLLLLGATNSVSYAATLACRLATLWFAVIIGIACLGWLIAKSGMRDLEIEGREVSDES